MLRYYVYISDAKIDMLLPQIPSARRRKVTREIGINWKILSAKQTSEYDTEQHRVHRLRALETYIRTNETVGSVSAPSAWFAGKLPMWWGPINFMSYRNAGHDLVWFTGLESPEGERPTVLGLGGSTAHLLTGHSDASDQLAGGDSMLYGITATLESIGWSSGEDVEVAAERADIDRVQSERSNQVEDSPYTSLLQATSFLLQWQSEEYRGGGTEAQMLDFLARRLTEGSIVDSDGTSRHVVVGTPLYVALAE
jgi:hypothetical protein